MKRLMVLFTALVFVSCIKDDEVITYNEQMEIDLAIIDSYLGENGITAINDPSGLRYVIHTQGTGINPTLEDVINVDYLGTYLTNGQQFDANEDIEFALNRLIEGWQIGFPLLNEGAEANFYIPSGLAYGTRPPPGIPSNAILIFEVALNSVVR